MIARRLGLGLMVLCLVTPTVGRADEEKDNDDDRRPRPVTPADAAAGKAAYLRECSACHGERGDGAGRAAEFVDPRPRDFTAATFKFRTTKPGRPPATADILRIIERGIPGTAMPAFAFLAPEERKHIGAYVLKLADLLEEPEPEPLDADDAPPAGAPTIARGRQVYTDLGCASCHGGLGRGDGPSAAGLTDAAGHPIRSRDLTQDHMRGGSERGDLYARLASGVDGTPMPAYGDAVEKDDDLWALADYVQSLRAPQVTPPLSADALEAGRTVAAKYSCRGCHVLDDGKGGDAGPDLRVSGQKLHSAWVRTFLKAPRAYGEIYPWRVSRMPHLGLSDAEVEVMTRYLAKIGNRPEGPATLPDPATFPKAKLDEGQLIYMLRCTECHTLGTVIATIPIKQQGPDLIRVAPRVDYEWAKRWIANPAAIDPKSKMTVPNITPEQVEAVRMFVWKAAIEAGDTGSR